MLEPARLVVVLLALSATVAGGAGAPQSALGVKDEQLARLFTPLAAPRGTFEVYRSPRRIEALAAELAALDPAPSAGAWKVGPLGPADAFGSASPYDAPKLAQLYVGTLPLVARGSLRGADGVVAYTLISPWPDASLSALQPGTMVIVVHVTALTGMR